MVIHIQHRFTTFLLFVSLLISFCQYGASARHQTSKKSPAPSAKPSIKKYTWRVTIGNVAPDCVQRSGFLVNGEFQLPLVLTEGEDIEITVFNDVPADFPLIPTNAISIHWHGFNMRHYSYYDGASFANQCPIPVGQNFTYRFRVDEVPGTYMWHGHNGVQIVDGLHGPLIVKPNPKRKQPSPPPQYNAEHTIFISDWYHQLAGLASAPLNRPFRPNPVDPAVGQFVFVGNPQAVIINGKGVFQDCTVPTIGNTTCNITSVSSISQNTSLPGCSHAEIPVEAGKSYLLRLINGGNLLYQSICFEGHTVTIVAADAIPVDPVSNQQCVDINLGQRLDVILTANQPDGVYWITAASQYRTNAVNGYALLRYKSAPTDSLPATAPPQPGTIPPWTIEQYMQLKINPVFLQPKTTALYKNSPVWSSVVGTMPEPNTRLLLNVSQPVLNQTGQLRWALNNIVDIDSPPCHNLQSLLVSNPNYLTKHTLPSRVYNANGFKSPSLGEQVGEEPDVIFLANLTRPMDLPINPVVGSHVAPLDLGEVVEVIIQNNGANAFNGGGGNRTMQEPHPFHLHGHHFWVLGWGQGSYPGPFNVNYSALNTANPPLRDTQTLMPDTYTIFRFVADNPGTWLLHCHVPFHHFMGQAMAFAEATSKIKQKKPKDMPRCPSPCQFTTGPWNISYTNDQFGAYMPPSPPPSPPQSPPSSPPTSP